MTLYSIYVRNGNRADFWVQHRTWSDACAQVRSVAGQQCGKLPGEAPLYGNAEVLIQGFDVRSGRPVELGHRLGAPQDRNYTVIAEPVWYRGRPQAPNPVLESFCQPAVPTAEAE